MSCSLVTTEKIFAIKKYSTKRRKNYRKKKTTRISDLKKGVAAPIGAVNPFNIRPYISQKSIPVFNVCILSGKKKK